MNEALLVHYLFRLPLPDLVPYVITQTGYVQLEIVGTDRPLHQALPRFWSLVTFR
jgi:hypothetical protein